MPPRKRQRTMPSTVPERFFTLREAAEIVGYTYKTILSFVSMHRELPVRYRKDHMKRKIRVLFASEVCYVRDHRLWVRDADGKLVRMTDSQRDAYPSVEWDKYVAWDGRPLFETPTDVNNDDGEKRVDEHESAEISHDTFPFFTDDVNDVTETLG